MSYPITQPGNARAKALCFNTIKYKFLFLLLGLVWLPLSAATFTVTDLSSEDPMTVGTLPWAIAQANATAGLDVIEFSTAGSVNLSNTLFINGPISIDGTTAPGYSAGVPSVVIQFTSDNGNIVQTSGSFSGLTIKGLEFTDETNDLTDRVGGLRIFDCFDVSIEANVFRKFTNGGLSVARGADVRVLDNEFINVGVMGGSFGETYILEVDGVNQGVSGNRLTVRGNTFTGGSNAISLANLPDLTVGNTGSPEVLLSENDGKNTVQGSALRITNCIDVVVEGLNLSYTGGGTTNGHGLYVGECEGLVVRNLTIGNRARAISIVRSEVVIIEDNVISNTTNDGINILGGNDIRIINNSFTNSGRGSDYYSLYITNVSYGTFGNRVFVRGNTFAGGSNAVTLREMPGITVANTGNPEVLLSDNDGKGTVRNTVLRIIDCPDIVIENFDLSYTEGQDFGGAGLYLYGCSNSVVRNITVGNRLDGILAIECNALAVENNTLENLPQFALSIIRGTNAQVLDNSITNCGGSSGVSPVEFKSISRDDNGNRLTASGFVFTNTAGGITASTLPGIIISDGTVPGTEISLTSASQLEQVDATVLRVESSPGAFVENLTVPPYVGASNKVKRGIRFSNSDGPTVRGVSIWGRDVGVEFLGLFSGPVTISGNSLEQNGAGIVSRASAGSGTVSVANNNFACNENAIVASTGTLVDAPNNYWGSADGSATDGGSGDAYLEDGGTITSTTSFFATPIATAPIISVAQIVVAGNGQPLMDGQTTTSVADDTDYGTVEIGFPLTRAFTVTNSGSQELNITGISINGSNDFTIETVAPVIVPAGASETVLFTYDPQEVGEDLVTVVFNYTSCQENGGRFVFAISGQGVVPCDLAVNIASISAESGPNANDGMIEVGAICNDCAGLEYSISPDPNGVSPQASNVFADLTSGIYEITVTDSADPACSESVEQVMPSAPVLTADSASVGLSLCLSVNGPSPIGTSVVRGNVIRDYLNNRAIPFYIADADTDPGNVTLTVTSDNLAVLDPTTVEITGNGAERQIRIRSFVGPGLANLKLTATDPDGNFDDYVINLAVSDDPALDYGRNNAYYYGSSDASTATINEEGYYWVADDENQTIRFYEPDTSSPPYISIDLNGALGSTTKIGIEASLRFGEEIYWMGSHTTADRSVVFSTTEVIEFEDVLGATLTFSGRYNGLRAELMAWDAANGHGLGANFLGFNSELEIQSMSIDPNNPGGALLGFRSPLAGNLTVIVPVTNLEAIVSGPETSGTAAFGSPILLNLAGNSIRGMECNDIGCLIIGGPTAAVADFRIWSWTGNPTDEPNLHALDLSPLTGEGDFESFLGLPSGDFINEGANKWIRLLADTGNKDYYGTGTEASDLPFDKWKKSRAHGFFLGEITATPDDAINITTTDELCLNAGVQTGLSGGTPMGGVYSGPGVTDDGNGTTFTFDPTAAAPAGGNVSITYTIVDADGFSASASDDVFVDPDCNRPCPGVTPIAAFANLQSCPEDDGMSPSLIITGTNVGAAPELLSSGFTCADGTVTAPSATVYYSFVAGGKFNDITVSSDNLNGIQLVGYVGEDCDNLNARACATGTGSVTIQVIAQPGERIVFSVAGEQNNPNDQGSFLMALTSASDCSVCTREDDGELVLTPQDPSGEFVCGSTVEVCFTLFEFNGNNGGVTEWIHSVVPTFGSGWEISTITPTNLPASCGGDGAWGYYADGWTACNSGQVFPFGFAYEGTGDNNAICPENEFGPGNNYGDGANGCELLLGPITWCFNVDIKDCPTDAGASIDSDLSISVQLFADGQSGSWTTVACVAPVYSALANVTSGGNQPPAADCQALTRDAEQNCMAMVSAEEFNLNSSDLDGDNLTYSVTPKGPYFLGTTDVVLTVSDGTFSSTCNTTITVVDNTSPTVTNCEAVSIDLDANGIASLSLSDLTFTASDNCTLADTTSSPLNFDCDTPSDQVITITVEDAAGLTSECLIAVTVNDNLNACENDGGNTDIFWLEAECAEVGSEWVVEPDVEASNGEYVVRLGSDAARTPPADLPENHIRFLLQDVAPGNYHLYGLVSAFKASDDSYWVRINGGPWFRWWQGIITGGEFNWNAVTGNPFPLTEGDNVIDFAYRENGAKLDKIHLNLTGTIPSGSGAVATNCGPMENLPPNAVADANIFSGTAPLDVTLNGTGSTDPDGTIVSYDWEWNGGITTGATSGITLTTPGTYDITLTVSDDDGATDTDIVRIVVNEAINTAPTAVASASPDNGFAPLVVQLDGSASFDAEGAIQSYAWDWGAGTASGPMPTQVTFDVGVYNVTLTVTDLDGESDTETVTVTVLEEPIDTDIDGVNDDEDNCPTVANPDQADFDGDGEGDVCDPDDDGDGVLDEDDCAPFDDQIGVATTVYYADVDGDGFGDPNDSQLACIQPDNFVTNATDNCPDVANEDQADQNNNGIGDACEDDTATDIFWLEAECAVVGAAWVVVSDGEASNGEYVVRLGGNAAGSPPANLPENHIRFSLEDVAAGNYHMYGLVSAASRSDDSFWIRINGGPWFRWWQGIIIGGDFNWNAVTGNPFPLTEGNNVIDFAYRENGAKLDKIHLNLTGMLPDGTGAVATNCGPMENMPPNAVADANTFSGTAPLDVTLIGTASTDPDGTIVSYGWEWNDDVTTGATSGITLTTPGTYDITLTVSDDDGATDTDVIRVVVNEPVDTDMDGIIDDVDNCPAVANNNQADFDGDGEGNVCDPDDDGDGVLDEDDCEPFDDQIGLPATIYYADFDGDGFGDPNDSQLACSQPDNFVLDATDNCPDVANEDQADLNNDGIGDACEEDTLIDIFWLEAECAEVGSAWVIESDGEASNGEYVVRLSGNAAGSPPADLPENHIRFSLEDVAAGNYHMYGLVSAASRSDDSFWIRINGGPWFRWWQGIIIGGDFNWNAVTGNPFPLTEGDNVIDFAYRENGAKLDKIHLNLTGTPPGGTGAVATNCDGLENMLTGQSPPVHTDFGVDAVNYGETLEGAQSKPAHSSSLKATLSIGGKDRIALFPNPVRDELNMRLNSQYEGQVRLEMIDVTGRSLQQLTYQKGAELLTARLSVGNLPSGTYYLRIIQGDLQIMQPFVKLPGR